MKDLHQQRPGGCCDHDVHHVNIHGMKPDDPQEAEDVPGLQAECEDEHAETADEGDDQVFYPSYQVVVVQEKTFVLAHEEQLGENEDRGDQDQWPGALQEALGRFLKKEIRDDRAQRKKDIEAHPVGQHADPLKIMRHEIQEHPQHDMHPFSRSQLALQYHVYDAGIEKSGEVPELVEVPGLVKDIGIIDPCSVRIGGTCQHDLHGHLDERPDQVRVDKVLEFRPDDLAQGPFGHAALYEDP